MSYLNTGRFCYRRNYMLNESNIHSSCTVLSISFVNMNNRISNYSDPPSVFVHLIKIDSYISLKFFYYFEKNAIQSGCINFLVHCCLLIIHLHFMHMLLKVTCILHWSWFCYLCIYCISAHFNTRMSKHLNFPRNLS